MRVVLIVAILFALQTFGISQTTSFTYQGKLTDNASAASGTYQMRFALFDGTGMQLGSPIENTAVNVENGVFTVQLDYAIAPFTGADRFLEISVRRNSGEGYVPLTPRQRLTSSPYAIRSLNSSVSDNASQLGGVNANQFVQTTDPRMSDDRMPLPGSSLYIQNTSVPQANVNFTISGTGSASFLNAANFFTLGGARIISTPGVNNMVVGLEAGAANTSGTGNSFYGPRAGFVNTTGSGNSFFGTGSGWNNTTGTFNSFYGHNSGINEATADRNTFFGAQAGSNFTAGSGNSMFGFDANAGGPGQVNNYLTLIGSGTRASSGIEFGTALGVSANVTTSDTVILGKAAGTYNGTARPADTVKIPGALNVTGVLSGSTISGTIFNTATQFNLGSNRILTANGAALGDPRPGSNTIAGIGAGEALAPSASDAFTGGLNAFFGYRAGAVTTTACCNSFFGNLSGVANTFGAGNVFVGGSTGGTNTMGSSNTFIGDTAGFQNTTGSFNTALGSGAGPTSANLTNATAIGSGAAVSTSNTVVLGRPLDIVYVPGGLGVGTQTPNAYLDVRGDIRLGAAGQYLVPGSPENLRIIRGVVSGGGVTLAGTGFSVAHPSTGVFTVTYSTAFTALPTVTSNVESGAGAARVVTLEATSASSATFRIFIPNTAALVDGAFHFIVIGPR